MVCVRNSCFGSSDAMSRLKIMRDETIRNSKEVVDLWKNSLCQNPNGLGNDRE